MRSILQRATLRGGALSAAPLLGAMLLFASCGADAPSSYHDYALRAAQASCERTFRCCGKRCQQPEAAAGPVPADAESWRSV